MALTLTEKLESRQTTEGPDRSITMQYILTGTSDDLSAKTLIRNSTAATYDGLVRQVIEIEPIHVDSTSGEGSWNASVRYGTKPAKDTGDSTFSFDMTGGATHITQATKHVSHTATPANGGKPAPDFSGAIGCTQNEVAGVDITVPVYNWTETHYLDAQDVANHEASWYALTGKTNNAAFKGFAAGEVLFLGCSGTKRGDQQWEITFKFAASPNVADFCADWPADVKPSAAVPKKGWEYVWVRYRETEDTNAAAMTKKATSVYIEQVYGTGNFAGLGIGT